MSAKIIQLRDYQQPRDLPRDLHRLYSEAARQMQAVEIMNVALYPGGIDDMTFDTVPSEMNPFVAPDKDSA